MALYFNGGTQPLVPCVDGWGEGVVMPGESFETDAVLGSPWTEDAEAAAALVTVPDPGTGDSSDSASDGHSEAQDASQPPSNDGPSVHVEADGDVVTDTGQVVGHVEGQSTGGSI